MVPFGHRIKNDPDTGSCYKLKYGMRWLRSFENIRGKIAAPTSILVNDGREQPDRHDIEMSQNWDRDHAFGALGPLRART